VEGSVQRVSATSLRSLAVDVWVVALTAVLLWPQRLAGYGFGHDMVFTPRQPLKLESVGLGSAAPRAVPLDGVVALLSRLVDGAVIGRVALVVPLVAAGWGAWRLLRSDALSARLVVAGFAVWNPFVVERLALGQWALLWAYGALPWLVVATARLRDDAVSARSVAGLCCALAACSLTPTGGLIGLLAVVAFGWSPSVGRTGLNCGIAALFQLPWVLPALTSAAAATTDPASVTAFASRSERPGGVIASLLGLGGIWNADVVPVSRGGALGYLSTALVLAALAFGWRTLRDRLGRSDAARLAVFAASGLLIAASSAIPGLSALLELAVRDVPGAGLLRDGQKWLMPFVLLAVLATGAAAEQVHVRLASPTWRPARLVGALALPLLLLPDAASTLKVPLTPVHYPSDWDDVAQAIAHFRGGGDVLALPFNSYHAYPWAPGRTVIDPTPRWVGAQTVVNDELTVGGDTLSGEDLRARRVGALLGSGAALPSGLAAEGIGWVVVQRDASGPRVPDLTGLQPVAGPRNGSVELYAVPDVVRKAESDQLRTTAVVGVDLMMLCITLVSLLIVIRAFGARLLQC